MISNFSRADELSREEDVLEWLIENKSTGDDEDVIEEVTAKTLGTLIQNIDNLVVVFCECCIFTHNACWLIFITQTDGKDDDDSAQVIEELEKIDDDCDKHGIQFVKIDDRAAVKEHGIKDVIILQKKPSFFIFFSLVSFQQLYFSRSKNQINMKVTWWMKMKFFTGCWAI